MCGGKKGKVRENLVYELRKDAHKQITVRGKIIGPGKRKNTFP